MAKFLQTFKILTSKISIIYYVLMRYTAATSAPSAPIPLYIAEQGKVSKWFIGPSFEICGSSVIAGTGAFVTSDKLGGSFLTSGIMNEVGAPKESLLK